VFDIRCRCGYRPGSLVVRDLKHAMARVDRKLLASSYPVVDRTLIRSWCHSIFKGIVRDGTMGLYVKEYEKVPADTAALKSARLSGEVWSRMFPIHCPLRRR
jgi:hypothetical protein